MRIPILKFREFLLVSVQMELDDATVVQFQEDLLNTIHRTNTKGVVIDLTSVPVIDSFIAKILGDVIKMAEMLGAKVVLTGIKPPVAITLVELGITLQGVETALNLDQGMTKLERLILMNK